MIIRPDHSVSPLCLLRGTKLAVSSSVTRGKELMIRISLTTHRPSCLISILRFILLNTSRYWSGMIHMIFIISWLYRKDLEVETMTGIWYVTFRRLGSC